MHHMTENRYQDIWSDRRFIMQFALLLSLIIAISLYLIYYSVHRVDNISLEHMVNQKHTALLLGDVEKEMNGNVITLEVVEDIFSDLAEMDLRQLQMEQLKEQQRNTAPIVVPPVHRSAEAKPRKRASAAKRSVIEITSAPVTKSRAKPKSLKTLRKKFYATNDVKYAYAIAERLIALKKYKEALKWSLIANEIAPESARSWILFAKTKLKMGKRHDAINVLQAYLKTYDSPKVSKFLKKIESQS